MPIKFAQHISTGKYIFNIKQKYAEYGRYVFIGHDVKSLNVNIHFEQNNNPLIKRV